MAARHSSVTGRGPGQIVGYESAEGMQEYSADYRIEIKHIPGCVIEAYGDTVCILSIVGSW